MRPVQTAINKDVDIPNLQMPKGCTVVFSILVVSVQARFPYKVPYRANK